MDKGIAYELRIQGASDKERSLKVAELLLREHKVRSQVRECAGAPSEA